MIRLHRLGHPDEPVLLNPDLLLTVEATPDTVITLTTGAKVLVAERPEEVADAVRGWRSSVIAAALPGGTRRRGGALSLVRATAGELPGAASPDALEERRS